MNEEQVRSRREKCGDCNGQLQEIRLIDKSHNNVHSAMEYTSAEARRSFWSGSFPVEGKVLAFMCAGCGRIVLYGAMKEYD